MESMSTTARNRQWLNAVVLSAVLLAVGCEGRKTPPNDVGAAVDEVALEAAVAVESAAACPEVRLEEVLAAPAIVD